MRLDPHSDVALFEQIAASIAQSIDAGLVGPGEHLPSAKALASALDVSMHTVLKAYQTLRDAGRIELRRGRGAIVLDHTLRRKRLENLVGSLVEEAATAGVSRSELYAMIDTCFRRGKYG